MTITWGAACRPKQGQSVSGDTYVICELEQNQMLIAVIDGLGGGDEAARAADLAANVVRSHPNYPLGDLIRQSHTVLHNTRGVVMALLRLDGNEHRAEFVGVGNIGIQVYSSQQIKPISKNGILGYRLPALLQLRYTYNPGDTFVLYSDGISSRFSLDTTLNLKLTPQLLADSILQTYGKPIDDATVVVVRSL